MRPFSLGLTTLIQGFYALIWVAVVMDVASPTFNLRVPEWGAMEGVIAAAVLVTAAAALGVVVHTISRKIFHNRKQVWAFEVLTSGAVQHRLAPLGAGETFPGGPTYAEALKAEGPERIRKAGEFMQAVEYQVLARAPHVWREIQGYRDQYRLARGFILISAAFAPFLPFWDPVRALDVAGTIGPFPIVRSQLFMLSVLASAVCYVAFRERAYRYTAAKLFAYATIEGERKRA
jgi:hypothetical protein